MPARRRSPGTPPITRERVLDAAIQLADEGGVEGLSMRRLGTALGVQAMSLYNHVPNKDAVVHAILDRVVDEIRRPARDTPWREAQRDRARSAREVYTRHPWAMELITARTQPGLATLLHHDAILGNLRTNGFPLPLAAHAIALLDAYVFGAVLQELALPFQSPEEDAPVAEEVMAAFPADQAPFLLEMITDHAMQPGYAFTDEFDWGLELVLDGLERRLTP